MMEQDFFSRFIRDGAESWVNQGPSVYKTIFLQHFKQITLHTMILEYKLVQCDNSGTFKRRKRNRWVSQLTHFLWYPFTSSSHYQAHWQCQGERCSRSFTFVSFDFNRNIRLCFINNDARKWCKKKLIAAKFIKHVVESAFTEFNATP